MKTFLIFMALLATSLPAFSQVGIGTLTPNRSSMLDVVCDTAGFLAPRMTNGQMNAITYKAVAGLMVYNKTYNQYYVFNGTGWQPAFSGTNNWSLTGNSNLNPVTNFLGTSDTSRFNIRVNNEKSGIIDWVKWVTGFGYQSLVNNTAIENTAFGSHALYSNTTGGQNVAIGNSTLQDNRTASNNTAVGFLALNLDTAGENTAVGSWAMQANISGTSNVAVGNGSLGGNRTGSNNTAIGFLALNQDTTGENTAVGSWSMFGNISGTSNVAVGNGSLESSTQGSSNTAIGFLTLNQNTASENTAVGSWSMSSNSTGTANAAVGDGSMLNNVDGYNNTAMGYEAMYHDLASENTAFGYQALHENTAGSANVAMGSNALVACLNGSYNTMVGTQADFEIGSPADISNATAIGYHARVTASNQVRLGNNDIQTLYCLGAYNSTTTTAAPNLYVSASGQIMRVTSPAMNYSPIRTLANAEVKALPANSSGKIQFIAEGCEPGQTAYASPTAELPDGLVIAYARVVSPGHVEVKLTNTTGQALGPFRAEFIVTVLN